MNNPWVNYAKPDPSVEREKYLEKLRTSNEENLKNLLEIQSDMKVRRVSSGSRDYKKVEKFLEDTKGIKKQYPHPTPKFIRRMVIIFRFVKKWQAEIQTLHRKYVFPNEEERENERARHQRYAEWNARRFILQLFEESESPSPRPSAF
jgi:hypothetical protein